MVLPARTVTSRWKSVGGVASAVHESPPVAERKAPWLGPESKANRTVVPPESRAAIWTLPALPTPVSPVFTAAQLMTPVPESKSPRNTPWSGTPA